MFFQQIYDKTLSQASYFIGCQTSKEALVIDAQRDVDIYLQIANQQGMRITHVAETHIHADFLAGSRELTALTGANLYLSDEGGAHWQYEFDHVGLKDKDVIRLGNLSLEIIHTPGHTPESISFLLRDHVATDEPVMIFTGDFLFVGDVGRPDLLEITAGQSGAKEQGRANCSTRSRSLKIYPIMYKSGPGTERDQPVEKHLVQSPAVRSGMRKFETGSSSFAMISMALKETYLLINPRCRPTFQK